MDLYALYLERPRIAKVTAWKNGWDVVLIVLSLVATIALMTRNSESAGDVDQAEVLDLLGESFIAAGATLKKKLRTRAARSTAFEAYTRPLGFCRLVAGLIPILLSLPLLLARWCVRAGEITSGTCTATDCCICSELGHILAYLLYVLFAVAGAALLYINGDEDAEPILDALTAIFAEVAIIYSITTLLRVPAIEEDVTATYLSRAERNQLDRSGRLSAPWASVVDWALRGQYHEQLRFNFPAVITSDQFEPIEDKVEMQALKLAQRKRDSSGFDRSASPVTPAAPAASTGQSGVQRHQVAPYHVAGTPSPSPKEPDGWRRRVSGTEVERQAQSTRMLSDLLNSCPPGWDSPWYITAIGRSDRQGLSSELLTMLLTIVSGASTSDRFCVQAAVTALGFLYFGTENRNISHRLFQLWRWNEISDIRDHCVASIKAIGNREVSNFMAIITALPELTTIDAAQDFFRSQTVDLTPLKTGSIDELTKAVRYGCREARLMALINGCARFHRQLPPDVSALLTLIEQITQRVLAEVLEGHMVKSAGLELIRRATIKIKAYVESPACSEQLNRRWNKRVRRMAVIVSDMLIRQNVFKSVRVAALATLRALDFPFVAVYQVFDAVALVPAFKDAVVTPARLRSVLEAELPSEVLEKVRTAAVVMGDDPDSYVSLLSASDKLEMAQLGVRKGDTGDVLRESKAPPPLGQLALAPWESAPLLYTVLLSEWNNPKFPQFKVTELSVQDHLNSEDRLMRSVGLITVGMFWGTNSAINTLRKNVVPELARSELISAVRDLAVAALSGDIGDCIASCTGTNPAECNRYDAVVKAELVKSELVELKARTENSERAVVY